MPRRARHPHPRSFRLASLLVNLRQTMESVCKPVLHRIMHAIFPRVDLRTTLRAVSNTAGGV